VCFKEKKYDYIVTTPLSIILDKQVLLNPHTGRNKLILGWSGSEEEYAGVENLVTTSPAPRYVGQDIAPYLRINQVKKVVVFHTQDLWGRASKGCDPYTSYFILTLVFF